MVEEGDEGSQEAGKGYIGKFVILSAWVGEDWGVRFLVCFVPHVLD